ncbi:MAG TPA: SDR family oxidoreductase [Candidatus Dormibacteraeota bacterium]|jgi:NAD(P)-dependent dehydrogenase (short-subunit alcohol dehydrogenase family)|nr:SDR family oxidoreductase [Candidatus Dormibacteraeota bacterium]
MFQSNLLSGKKILITGGATGLGKSMGRRFLELGASLCICGRREQVLNEAAQELRAATGGTVKTYVCDVRDAERVEAMIEAIWHDGPLDVLVNNAAGNFISRTEDLSTHAFEAVIGIVLMGSIHATMACGRRWLKERRKANVLNISATYAQLGTGYVVPSAVAKAGVLAMTRSLAVEWGRKGIRFNAVAPGAIPTEGAFSRLLPTKELEEGAKKRNPLGRFGTHEEFENLAAFLISDQSEFINGEFITMDGGALLQGAGSFNAMGDMLTDEQWKAIKPKKN